MLKIKRKFFQEIWFNEGGTFYLYPAIYKQSLINQKESLFLIKEEFSTLLIDLKQDLDSIHQEFHKGTKYKIRRAIKANINFKLEEDKIKFMNLYNGVSDNLNITKISLERLESFGEKIVITKAIYQGKEVIFHAYLLDKERVRLLYSVRNLKENLDNQIYGFANRFLHYEDISFFKAKDISIYDFGGISGDKEGKKYRVDKFKLSFGGNKVKENNYINLTMKVLLILRKILRGSR